MAILTDGSVRYRILCVAGMAKSVLTANSTANNATCDFKAWSGGNPQVWRVQRSGSSAYEYLRYEQNDYSLEIRRGNANDKDGYAPQTQKTFNEAYAMKWFLEPAYEVEYVDDEPTVTDALRTVEFNGYAYQAYFIHCLGSQTSRVLTCGWNGKSTAVIATKDITDDGQLFIFVPDSMGSSKIATPSSGAVRTSPTGEDVSGPLVSTSETLYPSFVGGAALHQGRYRTRSRGVSDDDDDLTSWSDWRCVDPSKGGKENYGLGTNVAAASLPATKRGARLVSNAGVAFALGSDLDRIDVQFQVRGFAASAKDVGNLPAHSALYLFGASMVRPISVSAATITALPEGVVIDWETDWARSCSTKVTCARLLRKALSTTAEMLEVPSADLCKAPVAGETYDLTFEVTTGDGAKVAQTVTAAVVSEGGGGLTLECTESASISTFEANRPDARAWLVVERGHGDRFVEFAGVTTGDKTVFAIPVPLGVPYKVWASYADVTNDTWGSAVFEFPAVIEDREAIHLTARDLSRDMEIAYNAGATGPTLSSSYSRERTEVVTAGGERPFYGTGRTTKATHKVEGVLVTDDGYEDGLADFDWLAHSSHIYLRSPDGLWAQGVADSPDVERTPGSTHKVSVSFNEEEW